MSPDKKLSSDEVTALVEELKEEKPTSANATTKEAENAIRPYVFGQNDTNVLGDYYALQMVNERLCRLARNVFLPMLRMQPRVSSSLPELCSFEEYRDSQDNFVSITNSRIEELRGNKLTVISPSFISLLTDAYYGGTITAAQSTRTEFTASESRVIEIVTSRMNEALQLAWRDLVSLSFHDVSHEENMQFAQFIDGEDKVVVCQFTVQLLETDPARFDIIYPLQTLKPIASQLRSRMQSDFVDDDHSWRDRLEQAVMEVPLTLTAQLCEPEITLRRMMRLQSGDVITCPPPGDLHILIEGHSLFTGQPGNMDGQSALKVTGRTTPSDSN